MAITIKKGFESCALDILGTIDGYVKHTVESIANGCHINFNPKQYYKLCKPNRYYAAEFDVATDSVIGEKDFCTITSITERFIGELLGIISIPNQYDPIAFNYIKNLIKYLNDNKIHCKLTDDESNGVKIHFTITYFNEDDQLIEEFDINSIFMDMTKKENFFSLINRWYISHQILLNN